MKILLVGEYSRLHNSLKEGLIKNGHQVIIIGNGDNFKKYPIDINTDSLLIKNNFLANKIRHAIYLLTKFDIASIETYFRFIKHKNKLTNYDYVQFINESPINITPYFEKKILDFIFRNNKNVFLSACGDDFIYISYLLSEKFPYSTISPLLNDKKLTKKYKHTLKYISKNHKRLHDFVFKNIKAVIPASVEYKIAYENNLKTLPLIPNAINIDEIKYIPLSTEGKIKIFHGINTGNYIKKGNRYFEEALKIIQEKYPNKIEIMTTRDLPYSEYIKQFLKAHIVLDQTHAHDQGYNALESMSMGKVVFTGAGEAFQKHYNLNKTVAIDATPDSTKIAKNLEFLILNPDKIKEISLNARDFIEQHHNYKNIAKKYIKTWKEYS